MMSNQDKSHLDRQVVALGPLLHSCINAAMIIIETMVIWLSFTGYCLCVECPVSHYSKWPHQPAVLPGITSEVRNAESQAPPETRGIKIYFKEISRF